MIKAVYKALSVLLSLLAAVLAGKLFEQVWKRLDDTSAAPSPTVKDAGWRRVLLAAALNGAIVAVVKAAVSRGGAAGVEMATGTWPGEITADEITDGEITAEAA
jgi:hypothetical protein